MSKNMPFVLITLLRALMLMRDNTYFDLKLYAL